MYTGQAFNSAVGVTLLKEARYTMDINNVASCKHYANIIYSWVERKKAHEDQHAQKHT